MYPRNLLQNGLSLKLDFGEGAPIPVADAEGRHASLV